VDELWVREVAKSPMKRPVRGSEVVLSRYSANPLPKSLKEAPINWMLSRNKYRKTRNNRINRRVFPIGCEDLSVSIVLLLVEISLPQSQLQKRRLFHECKDRTQKVNNLIPFP